MMMNTTTHTATTKAATMNHTARLLPIDPVTNRAKELRSYADHIEQFGPLPQVPKASKGKPGALVHELEVAKLRGRGGGWFPSARKMHAVVESADARRLMSKGRRPIVIGNAMEGEPASSKDVVLLMHSPHLVLDGLEAAARTIGADEAVLAIHRDSPAIPVIERAMDERPKSDVNIFLATPPARYVASEESALAHWLSDGSATPTYGARPFQRGVNSRPTLVQNAETLAHLALIARHGGEWFATVGDAEAPGTTLVSVGGAVAFPGVIEVPTGTSVREILERCGGLTGDVQGFLTGGYGGAWTRADELLTANWSPESVQHAGGVIGASILYALPADTCALTELLNIANWMAGESAGQCGPCRFGLPSVADDIAVIEAGKATPEDLHRLEHRLSLVVGRGGCKHPDGTARFVSTGLHVFNEEVAHHLHGRCSGQRRSAMPTPNRRQAPVSAPGKDFR